MTTEQIVLLLIEERDRLNRAIDVLQGSTKRRGRPPMNRAKHIPTAMPNLPSDLSEPVAKTKRHVSVASRRKMALAQKKRWAAIKAA
jgi:hypothetical protein